MSLGRPQLSIVIPAYNEAHRIAPNLERLVEWQVQTGIPTEVLVVDDGSHDATAEIVHGFEARGIRLLRSESNQGKGAALRRGVAASRGELVLISDADFSTPIREVERLMGWMDRAEVVLGSRAVRDARITLHQSPLREISGKMFNLAVRLSGVRGIRDTQCGFKLLRGDVARRLFAGLTVDRYAFDVELVWLAQKCGYRVVEVGVEWKNDPASRVHLLRDGLRMLVDLIRFRFRRHAVGP